MQTHRLELAEACIVKELDKVYQVLSEQIVVLLNC